MMSFKSAILLSFLCLTAQPARADTSCSDIASHLEQEYSIPTGLLSSIVHIESGSKPWVINSEGKGFYFENKEDAISRVRALKAAGVRSIDVGCAQINLRWHPTAFSSLEEAFDPEANIRYAARFLVDLKARTQSWRAAAGGYHSMTGSLSARYADKVYSRLQETPSTAYLSTRSVIETQTPRLQKKSELTFAIALRRHHKFSQSGRHRTSQIASAIGNMRRKDDTKH